MHTQSSAALHVPDVPLGHAYVVVPLHVGVEVAQSWASDVPDPVQVDAEHPVCPTLTHAPVVHWLSLVQTQSLVAALHTPVEQEGTPGVIAGSAVGIAHPRSSAVPVPVQVAPVHPVCPALMHLLPGQSVSLPH